jgi:two-component system phosphate regulon sensor histidine kinase PhoR
MRRLIIISVIVLGFTYTVYIIFRQKKLSDIKNDFINNMTHEFKTPIATISLATDAVNNPKIFENRESVSRYMGIIKEENQRMHKHVETILQMALLDKKDFAINKDEVNMHEIINKAVEQMQLLVEVKEGKIDSDLVAEKFVVIGDANLLFNSIMNLLDNANKYTPEKPSIKISTSVKEKMLSIVVEDNGIGMSREVQKSIFEKFYRAHTGNIHDVKGFGLGLSFVKAIATAHKGDVRVVRSEQGKGTTMELLIPFNLNTLK